MRIVPPQRITGGHRCAITGRSSDAEGFIETGQVLTGVDPTIEISVAAGKEIARLLGWVSPEEISDYRVRLAELEADFAEAIENIDKLTQLKTLETELKVAP